MNIPVVFLIFANQQSNPLPSLTNERKGIQQALAQADKNNHLRCVSESVTATKDIFKTFDLYRGQIKILHFGGHANRKSLALIDQKIQANGLAQLIETENKIGGIELIFLNACATAAQVKGLLQVGVKNVIATASTIQDDLASQFAQQFYHSFAAGAPLQEAYQKAIALLKMNAQVSPDYLQYLEHVRGLDDLDHLPDSAALPWGLYAADDSKVDYALEPSSSIEKQHSAGEVFNGGPVHNAGTVTNQINNLKGLEGGIRLGS